ncbi:MAG: DOMON-like domain-containing protein [Alphaproteobacteria bacterium]|nr:DOMON-like domain-containing protein [Alphaproteobacteria bacterium]MDE2112034.1 DOMON-like domain-containing protein [Alphaproteobacteria bacterium]MDE2492418.1 DOMON-like domain-containing protein [Alphaproteobacteria bacterium]
MHQTLKCHPDTRCDAVTRVEVEASRPRLGRLALRYIVSGEIAGLRLPRIAEPTRTDGLWKHACFEAFLRSTTGGAYDEFNFSPSTQWAAYRFEAYRSGVRAAEIAAPHIAVQSDAATFELQVLLELPGDAAWRLGLSAVIEETSGRLSYWALKHPPGKPDFHHSDCFALELPAPSRP